MHYFRYLIFIIISLFSLPVSAAGYYWVHQSYLTSNQGFQAFPNPNSFSSISAACGWINGKPIMSSGTAQLTNTEVLSNGDGKCTFNTTLEPNRFSTSMVIRSACTSNSTIPACAPPQCPNSGTPVPVYFDPNTPIPLRVCKANPDGTFCVYDAANKANPLVISLSEKQQIVLQSISSIPSPSCTPEFSKSSCDPKDPYGGCYKPPDDGCNRMADGSIYCPEGTPPPPIQTGCSNNATYCNMPPTGCGSNYVPGNFNGQQICVKNSNPPPTDPIDQPPPASEPPLPDPNDPNNPPPSSTPPPVIPPDNGPILRSILDAINAVNNKLSWVKDEIVNSVNNVSRTLGITNQKLDTVNSSVKETTAAVKETTAAVKETTAAVNNVKAAVDANATTVKTAVEANANTVKGAVDANTTSTANKLNEVVNAINNKPIGSGGSATNMEPTNSLLTDIKNFLTGGTLPTDNGEKIETKELTNQSFNTGLISSGGSSCPPDYPINWSTPFGTINKSISFENLCSQSSWIGYLVLAFAYMVAAGIVVRA
ncbi:methyl-accepting chemotaxis protein [Acinetobacter sp. WU_MDCI_Abxb74]|uniref:methyl-accepting chemotaxis protein n=1 Tax=Acinetobacter sp. WU_MDCI_Abxb74 TaxID=2850072 RepID=UPI0021CD54B1|nr:methyl-accepting chemotaxis protein [Acinetobacter sp. WU_MDCI_Abxb74]